MAYPSRNRHPDVLVIGGGAGGLSAARAAARRGATVVLAEQNRLGGDCTFTGCIPSKTLIEAAARGASFSEAMTGVHHAVESIAATEDDAALGRQGVAVVKGRAVFTAPGRVNVDGKTWRPRTIIIATGGRPAVPRIPGLEGMAALTNETVFDLKCRPARLAIIGGGAVGCELAQAFQRLGTSVIVIEAADRLLPTEERDASEVIAGVLRRDGVDVRVATRVVRAQSVDEGAIRLVVDSGDTVEVDALLLAVGRRATVDGLGLDAAEIEVNDHGVVVDDTLATSAAGVWAVGDVTGKAPFTHAADEMGRIAIANALGRWSHHRFRVDQVPSVVFTDPEVARIGPTEATLGGHRHRVAQLPMTQVDRAVAAGATDGFVKLIAAPRPVLGNTGGGRLVGATVVAPRAGEMMSELALAVRTKMFVGRIAQTMHPYPTWSVALRQAAAQFFIDVDGRRVR